MIAALFIETNGCYYNLPEVDPWDKTRDARLYAGPYPVVSHPPCERWGKFATWHGGTVGDDNGCFAAALAAVSRWGGVIEHPAHTKAWEYFDLPKPYRIGWRRDINGWSCLVEQGHYGHPARKATWLYYSGHARPPELIWGPAPQRLPTRRLAERGYKSARRCGVVANMSSKQRQRTPTAFRDVLLSIAAGAQFPARDIRKSSIHETDTWNGF